MSSDYSPLVSIIIPAYNAEKTIERAVDSALSQDYPHIEVVVVDDCSTDNTLDKLERYRDNIVLVRHAENKNGSTARNTGVRSSKGEFISFLDSDDAFLPNKLSVQINVFQSKKNELTETVAILCAPVDKNNLGFSGGEKAVTTLSIYRKEFKVNSSAILIKRSAFEGIGGFDESFLRHQDLEFLVRLSKYGQVVYLDTPLFNRIFSGSPSFQSTKKGIYRFWEKFSNDISSMAATDRNYVYAYGYRRLAELAFNERKVHSFIYFCYKVMINKPSLLFNKLNYYLNRAKR